MRRLFLRDCQSGDIVEDVFTITNKQLGATNQGKPYIKCIVGDRTGTMNARWWSAGKDIFQSLPDAGFIKFRGRIENYQNNLQFIIEQCWAVKEGSFDPADLLPQTSKDIDQMCRRLNELCGSIQNRYLAAIIQAYLDDENLMTNFCKAPAAMSFHHAFLGGLLEHTLNAMEVADAVCPFYPGLNRDLVLAGIFLHDIAKTWELTYETAFGYSDGGQLIGHIVKSVMWVEDKARQAEQSLGEPIPRELIEVLQHIILSHHDKAEFGSPKPPATPEAIAVHMIENMDAKLMMALATCRGEAAAEGSWTDYIKAFGGRLYRPDVAPPEPGSAADTRDVDARGDATASPQAAPDQKPPMRITNPLFEQSKGR